MAKDTEVEVSALIKSFSEEADNLILILHAIQNAHGYVPRESALLLSEKLQLPLARIYEVLTFYHYFRTAPPGEHTIVVCHGTSCWLNGSSAILQAAREFSKSHPNIAVEQVRCVGCCALAPLAFADKKIHSHLNESGVAAMCDELAGKNHENAAR